jgi:hypothetical protein
MKPILLGAILASGTAVIAGTPVTPAEHTEECCQLNLWTGEGASIGKWFFPEINYQAAAGSSTTDPARLAVGHHDPDRHGITQQAFEVAATIRLGEHVSLFGTYSGKVDINDHWLSEFEEYYAIFDLPGDLRIRGGRLQPHLGYQNDQHIHDYTFIDQYLGSARMFGEDPLVIYGGEVSLPVLRNLPKGWDDRLTVSFGAVPDPDDEEHEHEEPEPQFESEGALFADWAATANYTLGYNASDSKRYEIGVSGAWGGNEFGRTSQVYGLHGQYLWKPDGVAAEGEHHHHGGEASEFFRWRTEVFVRHFAAFAEEELEETTITEVPAQPAEMRTVQQLIGFRAQGPGPGGSPLFVPIFRTVNEVVRPAVPASTVETTKEVTTTTRDEFMDMGFYTALTYGFRGGKVQTHLRAEYVSGVSEAGMPERWRISPAIAWHPTDRLPLHFKVQYNYDHSPAFGDEHSIWAQLSVTWGDCCAH